VKGTTLYVSVTFTLQGGQFVVAFSETGLPTRLSWAVDLGGSWGNASAPLIPFAEPNGSYTFRIPNEGGYAATPASGTVTVAGQNLSVAVTFGLATYALTFTESGLPSGTNWSVTLTNPYWGANRTTNASTTSSIGFLETYGNYGYSVATSLAGYSANPATGSVYLNGTNQNITVTFGPTPKTYALTFTESGLPSGTLWSVIVSGHSNSSTTSSIGFTEQNGTHTYGVGAVQGYSASPSSGYANVSGSNVNVAVTFTAVHSSPPTYRVAFTETGLPNLTSWSVSLNGSTGSSNTTKIALYATNGSYHWLAQTVVNATTYNVTGTVNVSGRSVGVTVVFQVPSPVFGLSFVASGLPRGANWSLTLTAGSPGLTIEAANSLVRASNGAAGVSFRVSAGTYSYVAHFTGYAAVSGSVAVSVAAPPPPITVAFAPALPIAPTNSTPLAISASEVGVGIAFVLVGAVGILLTVYRAQRMRKERGVSAVRQLLETEWEPDREGEPLPRTNR
jgi:hypothetical protein